VFKKHRLPKTGSRCDILWVSYSAKSPTFNVFPAFSVAVMGKCCEARADGEYYFRSGFSTMRSDGVLEASNAVDQKSTGHTMGERS
jgi:hypothetical protein